MAELIRGGLKTLGGYERITVENHSKKPLIQGRVMIVGEGRIPTEQIDELSDEHMKIFLREPNPNNWPSEMANLRAYLPPEEQIKWRISPVLPKHEAMLKDSLGRWARSVWTEISDDPMVQGMDHDVIAEELAIYLKERIAAYLKE